METTGSAHIYKVPGDLLNRIGPYPAQNSIFLWQVLPAISRSQEPCTNKTTLFMAVGICSHVRNGSTPLDSVQRYTSIPNHRYLPHVRLYARSCGPPPALLAFDMDRSFCSWSRTPSAEIHSSERCTALINIADLRVP